MSRLFLICLFVLQLCLQPAQAQNLNIIRDVEIETTLKTWLEPLLKAANMSPDSVQLILVQSDQINAFVAGGANIFIYTGLIEKTDNPGEIIGVMAHELGHISGGHLIANYSAMRRASYQSILGTVLGIGAAILSGNGKVATAVAAGSQGAAVQGFLSHSRVNESSADQAALSFMNKAEINPRGLETFFWKLQDQELLPASQQDEYARTHPLTSSRIRAVEEKVDDSPYKDKNWPEEWNEAHKRMKAKLAGFIRPEHIPWTYRQDDQSFAADYARAIASYRENRIDESLQRIDALITQEPNNPYLYELKAQALVDFNRVDDALPALRKTVAIKPEAGLFQSALGHGLLETASNKAQQKEAIMHLEKALISESRSARVRRLLATAYGRIGEDALASYNLAEEAALQRRYNEARHLAQQAKEQSVPGSKAYNGAQDVLAFLDTLGEDAFKDK